MANQIRLKRASGSDPSASDLVTGEVAVRTDNGKLFTKKDDGSVAEISGGGIDDGDKGDITVSNSGATFTIDNGVIDNDNIATNAAISASKISGVMPTSGGAFTGNVSISDNAIEFDSDSGNTNKVSLQGPSSLSSNVTLTLPNSVLNNGVLKSNTTGTLSFGLIETANINNDAITTQQIADGTIVNGDISSSAAIDVSKLTGVMPLSGGVFSGDVTFFTGTTNVNILFDKSESKLQFSDNVKATFGSSDDLKIYHDGSDNIFESTVDADIVTFKNTAGNSELRVQGHEAGTATLSLYADEGDDPQDRWKFTAFTDGVLDLLFFKGNTSSFATTARFTNDGGTELRHTNVKVFETTSSGVTVTGTCTATTFSGSGASLTSLNASNISSGTIAAARVATLNQDTTGNAATATALETARNIGGVSFDGTGNINLPGVNTSGNQDTSGNAATATALATARTIAGVSFDGTANISLNNSNITNGAGYITATLTNEQVQDIVGNMVSGNSESGISVTYQDSDGTLDFSVTSQTDNNFTTTLKNKLDGIAAGATNVTNNNQISNGAGYLTSSSTLNSSNLSGALPAIDGSNLTGISAGATGGGSDEVFYENDQTVTTNYTITNGKNAMAAGPITINSGVTVTVGSGETLTIV